MSIEEELNEKLREFSCQGDVEGVYKCLSQGADVNSQNKMNGWTSLHWASKRGHINVLQILLKASADPSICNKKGERAADVAPNSKISNAVQSLSNSPETPSKPEEVGKKVFSDTFIPNYLKHPVFPYINNLSSKNSYPFAELNESSVQQPTPNRWPSQTNNNELVLKIRTANSEEKDFIEIELEDDFTFDNLVKTCIKELNIALENYDIEKLRKLPNTIIRKDKDVLRLQQFQEIEVVLKSKELTC